MLQYVRKTIATHALGVPGGAVRLIPNQLGEKKAHLVGVATVVLYGLLATNFWSSFSDQVAEPIFQGGNRLPAGEVRE